MSTSGVKRTRGEISKAYKENNKPDLAKKILGKKYSSASECMNIGGALLTAAIVCSAMFLGVLGGTTNGFGPVPGDFYPGLGSALGVSVGLCAVGSLIAMAIGYCKKRDILDERLSKHDVDNIIGETLKEVTEL